MYVSRSSVYHGMYMKRRWNYLLLLVPLLLLLLLSNAAQGGWIEDRPDGTTVIHLKLFDLPDPTRTDTGNQAEVAAVNAFKDGFPETFAER